MFGVLRMFGVFRMLRALRFIRIARLCYCGGLHEKDGGKDDIPRSSEPHLLETSLGNERV